MQIINYTLSNIADAANRLWQIGKEYSVWSFVGDMGAGKTTLISAICNHLTVQDTVSSPTYAIVNEYSFTDQEGKIKTIFHADWYRLKDAEDARNAGMEDIMYQQNTYTFIEWASNAIELLNGPYLNIEIEILDETQRSMSIK